MVKAPPTLEGTHSVHQTQQHTLQPARCEWERWCKRQSEGGAETQGEGTGKNPGRWRRRQRWQPERGSEERQHTNQMKDRRNANRTRSPQAAQRRRANSLTSVCCGGGHLFCSAPSVQSKRHQLLAAVCWGVKFCIAQRMTLQTWQEETCETMKRKSQTP